jgi:hypothetical protein
MEPLRRLWSRVSHHLVWSGVVAGLIVTSCGFGLHELTVSGGRVKSGPTLTSLTRESESELVSDQAPVVGSPSRRLGFGDPSREGRTTYPYVSQGSSSANPGYGTPASPTPTLDVITDEPYNGDEREFLHVTSGSQQGPRAARITKRAVYARSDEAVWLRIYVDNGASPEHDCNELVGGTIATHTTVRVAIWDSPDLKLHIVRAWIYAANAEPRWVTDAVAVLTEKSRRLTLIPSASSQYSEKPAQFLQHPALTSDALVEPAGMLLGADGRLGSCWENRFVVLPVFRQT